MPEPASLAKPESVTEPATNADSWSVTCAWDRDPNALSYNFYIDAGAAVSVEQPAVGVASV